MNERVRELRKALGLTLEAFASRIGIKKNSLSQIENGKNNLTEQNILLICKEYKVNENWLRDGSGEMFKERLAIDPVGDFVADLLEYDPAQDSNPFYDIIIGMFQAYRELDESSKQAMLNYFRLLKENLEKKKEGN